MSSSKNIQIPKSVDILAKVRIVSYNIYTKNNIDYQLDIRFQNMSEYKVVEIEVIAKGYDQFGNCTSIGNSENFRLLIKDLKVKPLKYGKNPGVILLPNAGICKLDMYVSKVVYDNGNADEADNPVLVETCQRLLPDEYCEFVTSKNKAAKYYAFDENDYWQCVCGNVNITDVCCHCKMLKESALEYTEDNIDNSFFKYNEQINENTQKPNSNKKIVKRIVILATTLIIILVGALTVSSIINKQNEEKKNKIYSEAINSQLGGDYSIAIEQYTSIIEYKDSSLKISECETAIQDLEYLEEAKDYAKKSDFSEAISSIKKISSSCNDKDYINLKSNLDIYTDKLKKFCGTWYSTTRTNKIVIDASVSATSASLNITPDLYGIVDESKISGDSFECEWYIYTEKFTYSSNSLKVYSRKTNETRYFSTETYR